jgi:hypothetical protein
MMAPNRQSGALQIATDIQGRANIPDVGSSGAGDAMRRVAGNLASVAGQVGQMADKAAAIEGEEAGKVAGLDPEFRPTKSYSIYGRSFDQAGLQVAETKTRQAMLADLDAVYDQHQNSPGDLQAALAEKRASWLGGTLPEIRPDLELSFDGAAATLNRQATRNYVAKVAAEQTAAMQTELEISLKSLHQKAFALGLDAEADKVLNAEIQRIARVTGRTDPTGKPLIDPAAASKLVAAAQEEMTTARIFGAFERLPSAKAKAEFIKTFEEDFAGSRGAAKAYDLDKFDQVRGHLRSELRRVETEGSTASRLVLSEIKSVADRAAKGFAAMPQELAAIEAQVASSADPDLAVAYAEARDLLAYQTSIRSLTPAELDGAVREMRAAAKPGASERLVDRITMAESLLDTMRTEIKQDPLGWAERSGRVSKVTPLDFSSADAAGSSLKARIAQADTVARDYGIEPQYLRPDEVARLSSAIGKGGDDGLAVTAALVQAAGDNAPLVMAEVSKQAPIAAMLGGHVAGVGLTPVAREASLGLALIKTDGFKSRGPKPQEMREAATTVLGSALASAPRDEAALMALANAVYEVRAQSLGLTEFSAEEWQKGLRELLGERDIGGIVYGGVVPARDGWFGDDRQIVLPPIVRQDRWQDAIRMITRQDLAVAGIPMPVDANGREVPMERVLSGTLVPDRGVGRYQVAAGDPDVPGQEMWIYGGKPGEPLVLDLLKLSPILAKRRPDLFIGGR